MLQISDQLESILSSRLDSETVEILRDYNKGDDENSHDLSILRLRQRSEINYNNTSNSLLGHNSFDDKDTSDIDFDPINLKHSSTIIEDSTQSILQTGTVNNIDTAAENKLINVFPLSSEVHNIVSNNSTLIKVPLPSKGSCDNSELKAEGSVVTDDAGNVISVEPRWKKKYFCIYCHKLVVKLPRHIELRHKDIEEVQQLKSTPKGQLHLWIISDFKLKYIFPFHLFRKYNLRVLNGVLSIINYQTPKLPFSLSV